MKSQDLVLAIVGSGGEGVASAGEVLVQAAANEGIYSMLVRSYGPQIRGGETLAQVRLSKNQVRSQGDYLDALFVLSWANFFRFSGEIFVKEGGMVFYDEDDSPPEQLNLGKNIQLIPVPFARATKELTGDTRSKNILALGFISGVFNLPDGGFNQAIRDRFGKKGEEVLESNFQAFQKGRDLALNSPQHHDWDWTVEEKKPVLIVTGNDAVSLGSLYAGVKFFSGYPITPASEIMEWMARELPKFDGVFVQTEDEIAAVTMAIGASFAGAKAMTATSGPGLSLMTEAIGLSTMAELPLVIVNVQRGGPSTGIPTKTSQSDLLHAVYGGHGNLPRVVLAPIDSQDAIEIAVRAFYLSEKYQVPVIVLTDQFLGQRVEVVPEVDFSQFDRLVVERKWPAEKDLEDYKRFRLTDDGISPVSAPGIANGMYTAAGIEHDEKGKPTSNAQLHEKMTEKRRRKLETLLAKEDHLIWEYGDRHAKIGILTWGSNAGVVREVVDHLRLQEMRVMAMAPRQLMPLPVKEIQAFVNQVDTLLIVELAEEQFLTYLKGQLQLPEHTRVLKRPGAAPFTVHEILHALEEENGKWKQETIPQKTFEVI